MMLVNVKLDVSWEKGLHFKVSDFIGLNGTSKTNLAILVFFYCGEFVNNPVATHDRYFATSLHNAMLDVKDQS